MKKTMVGYVTLKREVRFVKRYAEVKNNIFGYKKQPGKIETVLSVCRRQEFQSDY